MSSPLAANSAEATLTDWEGRIAVDTTSTVCCGVLLQHATDWEGRIAVDTTSTLCCGVLLQHGTCNGNSLLDKSQQDWCTDADDHDDSDNEDTSAVKTAPGLQAGRKHIPRGQLRNDLPALHYISPNRSNSGGRSRDFQSLRSFSRSNLISRQTTMGSSLLGDSMTEIVVEDLQSENEPTSAILDYCKRKVCPLQEILEFRKLLDHLNQRVAVPVCLFTVMNLAYAFAGFVYLFDDFDFHFSALKMVILNSINVLLWLLMGLIPFFLAASVTRTCQAVEANGHQIRVRPFVYHNTSNDDLNSTLLFASSLHMSAQLFRMPIQPNYVCFAILVVSVALLTLGMCLNLTSLGSF